MRQNFVVDNICELSVNALGDAKYGNAALISSLNSVSAILRSSSRSGICFPVDITTNTLLSFDVAIESQDVGASAGASNIAVWTGLVADGGFAFDANLSLVPSAIFTPSVVVSDRTRVQGRCVVPALNVPEGQVQLVGIGVLADTAVIRPSSSVSLQARMHLEDVHVFDPLRQ